MVRRLEEAHCPPALWQCDERKTEVAIHSDLLSYVDCLSAEVAILYSAPEVGLKIPDDGLIESNRVPKKLLVYQERGWSQVGIESWRKLYIEKMSPKEVFKFFYQNYPAGGKDALIKLQKEADELKKLAEWEELETGLPEVF